MLGEERMSYFTRRVRGGKWETRRQYKLCKSSSVVAGKEVKREVKPWQNDYRST